MKLTATQLTTFHQEGFIVLRNFLDVVDCDRMLEVIYRHLEEKIEPIETEVGYDEKSKAYRTEESDYSHNEKGSTIRRLRQVYERDVRFKAWMENEAIRPVLQQILEDSVSVTLAHHNSIMTKMPRSSTETKWHQDRRYWRFDSDNLLSVWLALGSEYSENGALEVIPQSHKMSFDAGCFDEKEYFSSTHSKNKDLIEKKRLVTLEKGDVLIFHSLLLHRANQNVTDLPKISFVYTVKGEKVKAQKGTRSDAFDAISLAEL